MADKTKSIKSSTDKELDELLFRLRKENEVQDLVMNLKRKSMPSSGSISYDQMTVSTEEPIESLYHDEKPSLKDLKHYGVLGMRWGVRKDQQTSQTSSLSKKKKAKSEDEQIKDRMRADVKARRMLSDKDLTEKIARLEKEKRLRELTDSEINGGKAAIKDILKNAGTKTATAIAAGAAMYAVKVALTGKVDLGDMAGYVAPKPKK